MRRVASIGSLGGRPARAELDEPIDEKPTLVERFVGERSEERPDSIEDSIEGCLISLGER